MIEIRTTSRSAAVIVERIVTRTSWDDLAAMFVTGLVAGVLACAAFGWITSTNRFEYLTQRLAECEERLPP